MRQMYSQLAEGQEMQRVYQGQRINMEGWAKLGLRTVICWRRDRCRSFNELRHHKLISFTREQASFGISLPYSVKLGNALNTYITLFAFYITIFYTSVCSCRLIVSQVYSREVKMA